MPRYIDENDVYKLVEPTGKASVHCSQIDALPRADVAPRAEAEREIFEEIEKSLCNRDLHNSEIAIGYAWAVADMRIALAKLKKKYMEEGK